MTDTAVVGRHLGVGKHPGALGPGRVAESEQRRRAAELVLPDRQRRDPDPATDQQRAASVGRRGEPDPERTDQQEIVPGLELTQPVGAGTDVLDQEFPFMRNA